MTQEATGRTISEIPVYTLANGHDVRLYVHELKGAKPGPVLGLVAGNALPENVVRETATNGLAFRPHEPYRTLLKTAGTGGTNR